MLAEKQCKNRLHPMKGDVKPQMKGGGMPMETSIIRPVQVLRGYKKMANALHVSEQKMRDLICSGAPVVYDRDVPRAEAAELWLWYATWLQSGKNEKSVNPPLRPDSRGKRAF